VGCEARPRGGVPSARGSGWPCGPRACTPHGAAAVSALLRGYLARIDAAAHPLPRCRLVVRMGLPTLALAPPAAMLPSPPCLRAPYGNARGSRSALTGVGNRKKPRILDQSHVMRRVIPAGEHRSSASLVAALTLQPGRQSCMGGTRCEKGIVVSVAPAGPMSEADRQFRPGSSGAKHAYKRTSTSLAQRVARMKARKILAKPELCKANEGMTCTCTCNTHRCAAPSQTSVRVSLAASAPTSAEMPASLMELPSSQSCSTTATDE